MTENMNILKGMHELTLIDEKIQKRKKELGDLCVRPSSKKAVYLTNQTERVKRLEQSILDLAEYKYDIKAAIAQTCLNTRVTYEGVDYTLHKLVYYKQKGKAIINDLYRIISNADELVSNDVSRRTTSDSAIEVIRHYDPEKYAKDVEKHMNKMSSLEALLNQANIATSIGVSERRDEFDS